MTSSPKQIEEDTIVLGPAKEFFESYIGVFVVGFDTFAEDIPDLESKVQAKMLMGVEIDNEDLWLKLTKINGQHGGYIKISPAINGQFAEIGSGEEPIWASRYRIKFYGKECIEYIDSDDLGTVSYLAEFKR